MGTDIKLCPKFKKKTVMITQSSIGIQSAVSCNHYNVVFAGAESEDTNLVGSASGSEVGVAKTRGDNTENEVSLFFILSAFSPMEGGKRCFLLIIRGFRHQPQVCASNVYLTQLSKVKVNHYCTRD